MSLIGLGLMDITYLGHSSFRIKGKKAALVTDPYDSKAGKFPNVSADIVTVSHDHFDHNQTDLVKDVKRIVKGPGEYEIGGVSIIGIPTFHDDKKGEERGKNTVYVIEMDGFRLAHLGDLGHKLSSNKLEELGTIDILMIPVGGVYTIGPSEASEVIRDIEPSVTIPMHYKTPELDKSAFGELLSVDEFLKDVGLSAEKADKFSAKKTDLAEEQKIVVLSTK